MTPSICGGFVLAVEAKSFGNTAADKDENDSGKSQTVTITRVKYVIRQPSRGKLYGTTGRNTKSRQK